MKIWHKYLFCKLLKTFLFFFCCLFLIYIVIDLSVHGVRFFSKSQGLEIASFYLHSISSLLDLFFSLTFLLALMRVLIKLNTNRELLALQMAGVSKKKLLAPFFIFALMLAVVGYLNAEWIAPEAQELSDGFKSFHKPKKMRSPPLFALTLGDDSQMVYQSSLGHVLFDLYWIRSAKELWHMKQFDTKTLEGSYVDHLIQNEKQQMTKGESFEKKFFPEIPWNEGLILHRFVPYEHRSISTLLSQTLSHPGDQKILLSHLYYKLLMPLIPLIVLVVVAPLILRYLRIQPIFFLAAYSIFGLISLKVILDGMLILGENQVLPSYVAIFSPILMILLLGAPRFAKMA